MNLPSWIWPLSWYRRIQDLEATVQALKLDNKKLVNELAVQSITNASMSACYLASMESVMKQAIDGYALKAAAERDTRRYQAEWEAACKAAAERAPSSANANSPPAADPPPLERQP